MSALCQKRKYFDHDGCALAAKGTGSGDRKLPRWFKAVALLAPRRWHDELVTSAAALSDPRAIAKLQILRQTQS